MNTPAWQTDPTHSLRVAAQGGMFDPYDAAVTFQGGRTEEFLDEAADIDVSRHGGLHFEANAAQLSRQRTLDFFRRPLQE